MTQRSSELVADSATDRLRLRIQNNELTPGTWLRESAICQEFGIGRTIARRVLRALADDGLVEIEENRGARVSATTVEEVFDLYEVRAELYGLATRFACMRMTNQAMMHVQSEIERLLTAAETGASAEDVIGISEDIFSFLSGYASPEAQRMIAAVRRKTRFHYSYIALALQEDELGPFPHWRRVKAALLDRDAAEASNAARNILYYMQANVARIMLAQGPKPISPRAFLPDDRQRQTVRTTQTSEV